MKSKKLIGLDAAIEKLGGMTAMAKTLGLNGHATVYQWKQTRVPAEHCPAIEAATGGLVRCEDLRPDVAWDVLRVPAQAGEVA